MAYCVRCGVKLEDGATQCPLCGTPVQLPASLQEKPAAPLFSKPLPAEGQGGVSKTRKGMVELIVVLFIISEITVALSFWFSGTIRHSFIPLFSIAFASCSLLAIVLAKPSFATHASRQSLVVGIYLIGLDFSDGSLSWSLIASGALLLAWILAVFPFIRFAKSHTLEKYLLASAVGVLCYPLLVNWMTGGKLTWYWPVALPSAVALLGSTLLLLVWLAKRKSPIIPIADVVLGALAVLFFSITAFDLFLTRYLFGFWMLSWSASFLIASLLLLSFLISVSFSPRLRRFFTSHNLHN